MAIDLNTTLLQSISTSTIAIDLNTIPDAKDGETLPDLNEDLVDEQGVSIHPLHEDDQDLLQEGHPQHLHISVHGIDLNDDAFEEEPYYEGESFSNFHFSN